MPRPQRLHLQRGLHHRETRGRAVGAVRRIGVVAACDLKRGLQQERARAQPERLIGVLERRRRPPRRRIRRLERVGIGRPRLDLLRAGVARGGLWRAGQRRRRWRRQRTRFAGLLLGFRFLLLADRAGGVETGFAGARRRHDVFRCRQWRRIPRQRACGRRRGVEALHVPRIGERRLEWRRPGALGTRLHAHREMDECRRQRCERESRMLMATARQRLLLLAQCVAPAFARLLRGERQPACGRLGRPVVNGV